MLKFKLRVIQLISQLSSFNKFQTLGVDILYLGGIIVGYFNIIESLRDKHIDEDMLSVSGVNSNSIDSLLKALNKMDAKYLKGSDVKVDTEYYFNNSPFSRDVLSYVVKWEDLPSYSGKDFKIYHLSYWGDDYILVCEYANIEEEDSLCRCAIHSCSSKDDVDAIWDDISKGKVHIISANDTFKGCEIISITFMVSKSVKMIPKYKSGTILVDSSDVFGAMFSKASLFIKSQLPSSRYDEFISKLKDTCIEYDVSLERTTLEFSFRFNSKVESSMLGNFVVSFIHTNDFCKIVQFDGYILIKFFF